MHGVGKLAWDDKLAKKAQSLAEKGEVKHSSAEELGDTGENIAWGPSQNATSAVEGWYNEVEFTKNGTAESDKDHTIGHYTQVVWKSSLKLGCAKGKATKDGKDVDFWVCQYSPQGNVKGKFKENVLKRNEKTVQECKSCAVGLHYAHSLLVGLVVAAVAHVL